MQSEKIACVTRELEDLLMIEEKRGTLQEKKGSDRLEQYAKEQYPEMRHGKVSLNPCYNCYTTIFSDTSGREVLLNCSWHGWISDDLRP